METLKSFKLAVLQTKCVGDKQSNLSFISEALNEAGKNGAKMAVLGEICNSPFNKEYMHKYAEDFSNSETINVIGEVCKKYEMYAIGSISRKEDLSGKDVFYNSAFIVGPEGKLIGQMDKIHLFDVDVPGKITFKESDIFTKGNEVCVVDTSYCKIGVGICHDVRFPELATLMTEKGARVLIYPGRFNLETGALLWELQLRGRAVDNQCYTVGVSCAPAKESPELYEVWGHSTVADPLGRVLVGLDKNPGIGYCEINVEYTEEVRNMIPIMKQKREDMYKLEEKN